MATPTSITPAAGTPQNVTISTDFAIALAAIVRDVTNTPVSGVVVTFTAPLTGASGSFVGGVAVATATTNGSGIATAPTFTANTIAGSYIVTAVVVGVALPANFSLTNSVGTPVSITVTVGTSQSATVSTSFPKALAVLVTDAGSNPLSNVDITFTTPSSGPSATFVGGLLTITVKTNSSGIATAPLLTANTIAGKYTVRAVVVSVSIEADFILTNTAGAPTLIVATGGTPQKAELRTNFARPLVAAVNDANSNPVSGVTVTFTIPTATASGVFTGGLKTATTITNDSGIATAPTITANSRPGSYTVMATVVGIATPANFILTNTGEEVPTIDPTANKKLGLANIEFKTGLNFTVRAGAKWADIKLGDFIDVSDLDGTVQFTAVICEFFFSTFDKIPVRVVRNHHMATAHNVDQLFTILQTLYGVVFDANSLVCIGFVRTA